MITIVSKDIFVKKEHLFFFFCQKQKYFLLKSNQNAYKYYFLPLLLNLRVLNSKFIFSLFKDRRYPLDSYINSFNFWLKSSNKIIKKKMILKGLGFRCFLAANKQEIHFKIGYSHIVVLNIPDNVSSINVDKNFLTLEGHDQVSIGNFAKRIKQLKKFDIYKNKGFSYKNDVFAPKAVKKK